MTRGDEVDQCQRCQHGAAAAFLAQCVDQALSAVQSPPARAVRCLPAFACRRLISWLDCVSSPGCLAALTCGLISLFARHETVPRRAGFAACHTGLAFFAYAKRSKLGQSLL